MVWFGKKTWLPRGSFSLYLYSKKACEHSRSHMFCLIIMKFCQNISYVDVSDEFENGRDQWKNMAAREWGSFLYMYIVTTCEQSRRHIFFPNLHEIWTYLGRVKKWFRSVKKTWPPRGHLLFILHDTWLEHLFHWYLGLQRTGHFFLSQMSDFVPFRPSCLCMHIFAWFIHVLIHVF